MATKAPAAPLIGEQLEELLRLIKGADSVELKLTVPESAHSSTARALGHGSAGSRDPPGLLLRHTGPRPQRTRRRRSRATRATQGRRHRRQAPPRRTERAAAEPQKVAEPRGRGRRHAGRLRVLRVDEGRSREARRQEGRGGETPLEQDLLEGAERLLRDARAGRAGARRPHPPRADPRYEAEVPARRAGAEGRGRAAGCIRTTRASSSSRRSARPPTRSRSRSTPSSTSAARASI